eukprot:sb/3462067/
MQIGTFNPAFSDDHRPPRRYTAPATSKPPPATKPQQQDNGRHFSLGEIPQELDLTNGNDNIQELGTINPTFTENEGIRKPTILSNGSVQPDPLNDSIRLTLIELLMEDSYHFRNIEFRIDRATLYQFYQHPYLRYAFHIIPLILIFLPIVESPGPIPVHWYASHGLELVCLFGCTCRAVHMKLCVDDYWKDRKNKAVVMTLGLCLVDLLVNSIYRGITGKTLIKFSRALRPLLILNLSENRNLRKLVRNIKRTVADVAFVLLLIFLFIVIFAMMATKFFRRRSLIDPHGDPYLDNFFDSFWNLYVLMTTANSPDVSIPALQEEAAFFIFFFLFSVGSTYLLMNILLAVVYKHYKLHLLEEVREDVRVVRDNMTRVFALLTPPDTRDNGDVTRDNNGDVTRDPKITRETWSRVYHVLGVPENLNHLYWDFLSQKTEGITQERFMMLPEMRASQISEEKKNVFEVYLPFYNSTISCYIRWMAQHIVFSVISDLLIVANAVTLAVEISDRTVEIAFLIFFNLEIMLRLYSTGPHKFLRSPWNAYDCVVIWTATVLSLVVKDESEFSAILMDIVLTLRVMRLLRLLGSIKQTKEIINTIFQIVPSCLSYCALLVLIYYAYAIVGMELFSGLITNTSAPNCGNSDLNGTDFAGDGYCYINFNSFLSALLTLWAMTLVNQWHVIAGGHIAMAGSKWYRLYFLSFHVTAVLIVLNIFLAFIIEAFMLQLEGGSGSLTTDDGLEEHLTREGINAKRPSLPTWWLEGASEEVRVRYKRSNVPKNYNQLLLEMYKNGTGEVIQSQTGNGGGGVQELGVVAEQDLEGEVMEVVELEVAEMGMEALDRDLI